MRSPLPLLAGAALVLAAGLTTVAVAPPAPAPAAAAAESAPSDAATTGRHDLTAYRGLGTWLDAYDWDPAHGGTVPVTAVDEMARRGVRTLYLQAARKGVLLAPDRLGQLLVRAHARGLRVQAWYLPLLSDPAADRRAVDAVLAFRAQGQRFDTFGLDIEWRNGVPDVAERNRRVVALSQHLRETAPDLPLAAVVVAPVVTDEVNPDFWRPFPWAGLAPLFDVWQPMGYWTDRKQSSVWADPYTSTQADVRLLRRDLGRPDAPVHPIGGVGAVSAAAADGFVRAAREEGALGGSVYDWSTTPAARYAELRRLPS